MMGIIIIIIEQHWKEIIVNLFLLSRMIPHNVDDDQSFLNFCPRLYVSFSNKDFIFLDIHPTI